MALRDVSKIVYILCVWDKNTLDMKGNQKFVLPTKTSWCFIGEIYIYILATLSNYNLNKLDIRNKKKPYMFQAEVVEAKIISTRE